MQPPRGRAHVFRHGSGKGDDVVLGDFFDGFDARDIEGPALANVACGFRRNDAGSRHRFGCGHLNLQPGLYLRWSLQMRPISGWV